VEPSIIADSLTKRNIEVEAIIGNIIKITRVYNIKILILQMIYILVTALNYSFDYSIL
jgi:ketopantoate reductase